jgi:hypothetical protein
MSAAPGVDRGERATRIELALSAWEADVLPLNYARVAGIEYPARNMVAVSHTDNLIECLLAGGQKSGATTITHGRPLIPLCLTFQPNAWWGVPGFAERHLSLAWTARMAACQLRASRATMVRRPETLPRGRWCLSWMMMHTVELRQRKQSPLLGRGQLKQTVVGWRFRCVNCREPDSTSY